ncbi:hypothetical protein [Caldicellulosiruptor acetigenus]|uniref:CARDB domain-containing protein n=1 Tax=Caldicellulosiruptor acetigenus 6A TaxID=632516 RepID=G2PV33_9FIRM|nr:hypothetical protein [Caldicellulosiruptor acetigenus]AEM72724.1 hypothetical protein Calla_0029 [Caldicellulosiruptor acetigenus 6A]
MKKKIITFVLAVVFTLVAVLNFGPKTFADQNSLIIQKVWTDPSRVAPGSKFTLNFELLNNSEKSLYDITIKLLSIEGRQTLSGFSPIGMTNEMYLKKLQKGEKKRLSLNMMADVELKTGVYNLVLSVSFKEDKVLITSTKIIGIVVGYNPQLLVQTLKFDQTTGKLNLKIVNVGKCTLENVLIEVFADNKISSFVGTLENGDDYQEAIEVDTKKQRNVKVVISYNDQFNRKFTITKILKAPSTQTKSSTNTKNKGNLLKSFLGLGD